MWVIAIAVLGVLVVVVLRAFNNQGAILRDWERVLSPWGLDACHELEHRLDGESRMAEYAYRRAFMVRAGGSPEEAVRMLEAGLHMVERTSPEMIKLLREMAIASRMAAAISPVAPLRPQDFSLPRLSGLAIIEILVQSFLFSTAERFRLRVYVLRRSLGIVRRLIADNTERIRSDGGGSESDWDRIEAARADLQRLLGASLQSFRVLVVSLSAAPR